MSSRIVLIWLCIAASSAPSLAFADVTGAIAGQVKNRDTRAAVGGATVILTDESAQILLQFVAGADGAFAFDDLAPGTYQILVVYGGAQVTVTGVRVEADQTHRLTPLLDLSSAGEQITIRERIGKPAVPAEPIRSTVPNRLPYSDKAIDNDVWGLAWILLSVDATGKVVGVQFLKRPGNDLDRIAVKAVFKMRFEPARDASGRPIASTLLWKIEWPSYWWLQDPATHPKKPPCAGKAPLPLDYGAPLWKGGDPRGILSQNPIYSDCSPPDFTRAAVEPVITAP